MDMITFCLEHEFTINIDPINGVPLKNLDFEVAIYVYANKSVSFKKNDTAHVKPIDNDTYLIIVDFENASKIGRGREMAKVTLQVPNNNFKDGYQLVTLKPMETGWNV